MGKKIYYSAEIVVTPLIVAVIATFSKIVFSISSSVSRLLVNVMFTLKLNVSVLVKSISSSPSNANSKPAVSNVNIPVSARPFSAFATIAILEIVQFSLPVPVTVILSSVTARITIPSPSTISASTSILPVAANALFPQATTTDEVDATKPVAANNPNNFFIFKFISF